MKYIILLLVLTLTGCALLPSETPSVSRTTARVSRGDLVLGLSADGSITLPVTGLDFAVSGIIKNIFVSPGERVRKGDLLAELDDTDLRLALKNAQNNLEKAQLAYEDAVSNAEFSLQSELMNYQIAKEKLNTVFDAYTYEMNIENALLSLARRHQDYAESELNGKMSEESARLTLARRQAELNESEAELIKAKAELEKAESEEAEAFDAFNHQNTINTAQTTLERARKALDDAGRDLRDTQRYYAADLNSENSETVKAAREIVAQKENVLYNALNSFDDAEKSLDITRENLRRDIQAHDANETERKENTVEAVKKTVEAALKAVEQAKQTADDAKTALDKTLIDNEQRLLSASQAIDDAEAALTNAMEEQERGLAKHYDDLRDARNAYNLQKLKLENLTNSDLTIKNALFSIEEAKTALEAAENDLVKIRITAPIDGEVLNITKRVGEKVSETESAPAFFMGSSSTSSSLITLRDMSEIYLSANIPEGDIVGLNVGQPIRMEVDALGDTFLYATVYSISSIPNQDATGIVTYEVIGILDEFNPDIRDRMSVFMTFIKREINNVLLIPNRSVFMEDGQQYVYVQHTDGALEKRAVVCGFSNGIQTEVSRGLEQGETVVVGRISP
jgi:HlyD family secretion protein